MAGLIDTSGSLDAPSVSLAPAIHDAQKAMKDRRKEDIAIEEAVKEVLALAKTQRPENTSRNYGPKQKEWRVSFSLFNSFLLPYFCSFVILYGFPANLQIYVGLVPGDGLSPWRGVLTL